MKTITWGYRVRGAHSSGWSGGGGPPSAAFLTPPCWAQRDASFRRRRPAPRPRLLKSATGYGAPFSPPSSLCGGWLLLLLLLLFARLLALSAFLLAAAIVAYIWAPTFSSPGKQSSTRSPSSQPPSSDYLDGGPDCALQTPAARSWACSSSCRIARAPRRSVAISLQVRNYSYEPFDVRVLTFSLARPHDVVHIAHGGVLVTGHSVWHETRTLLTLSWNSSMPTSPFLWPGPVGCIQVLLLGNQQRPIFVGISFSSVLQPCTYKKELYLVHNKWQWYFSSRALAFKASGVACMSVPYASTATCSIAWKSANYWSVKYGKTTNYEVSPSFRKKHRALHQRCVHVRQLRLMAVFGA